MGTEIDAYTYSNINKGNNTNWNFGWQEGDPLTWDGASDRWDSLPFIHTEAYINGKFLGRTENCRELADRIREERRKGSITSNLNVAYNEEGEEVHIECSKGRARRPLIIVKKGQPMLTERHLKQLEKNEISWSDLIKQGVIYLDLNMVR